MCGRGEDRVERHVWSIGLQKEGKRREGGGRVGEGKEGQRREWENRRSVKYSRSLYSNTLGPKDFLIRTRWDQRIFLSEHAGTKGFSYPNTLGPKDVWISELYTSGVLSI